MGEEYSRSLKVSYKPSMLQACSKDVGEYEVTYTITTPWTDPPFAEVTRKVIVEDVKVSYLSACLKLSVKIILVPTHVNVQSTLPEMDFSMEQDVLILIHLLSHFLVHP